MNSRKAPANPAAALIEFCRRCRADAEVRARVARGDASDLDRAAANIPAEAELRIIEQTADTFCFPLPPAPDQALSDAALETAAGGRGGWRGEHRRCVVMGPCAPDACLCGM